MDTKEEEHENGGTYMKRNFSLCSSSHITRGEKYRSMQWTVRGKNEKFPQTVRRKIGLKRTVDVDWVQLTQTAGGRQWCNDGSNQRRSIRGWDFFDQIHSA